MNISIHAPHEGERLYSRLAHANKFTFQSTLPTRGSDAYWVRSAHIDAISIHAPHEGERQTDSTPTIPPQDISIHAPHEGERRDCRQTPSRKRGISIHAPHEGERPRLVARVAPA